MPKLLDFTQPHVLRDEAEYNKAIEEIDWLLDADPPKGSAEHERLEFLSVLVEEYEERHFPMGENVSPQAAVDFMLEQKGLERSDLAEWLGGRSRVSEFFSGKRPLSKGQVEALREHLGLSADLLLR
jgi:HTH-type transcriptional regulator/antitoxin HigA